MNSWNGLDFFIFLIFLLNTLFGMSRGATKEIIALICLSIGLIFMIKFTVPLANFLNTSPIAQDVVGSKIVQNFMISIGAGPLTMDMLGQLTYCISLLICFVGVYSICGSVLYYTGFVDMFSFPYAILSRKVGAALGCTRGYVFTLILIVILALHIFKNTSGGSQNSFISGSSFVSLFQSTAQNLDNLIAQQQPENYKQIYQNKNLYNTSDVYRNVVN